MKKIYLLIIVLITLTVQGQEKNSLHWEISGKGLTKKSFLYGTMHVNEKISYHLSDAFYNDLLSADIVANESDPETWIDVYKLVKENNITDSSKKFYSKFYLNPIERESINTLFYFNGNALFANILSGSNDETADFQENTVLDTFIYQTGRKYKKKCVGLEDAKESILSILKLKDYRDTDKEAEANRLIAAKAFLKDRNLNSVMNDCYREKNITLLDSLYKLSYSKHIHDVLIVKRNEIMAESIDSLVKKGSLFAAVGAAHLAGKQGIIQLLRNKGYTVTPVFDALTQKGLTQKKTIENYFGSPEIQTTSSQDKMIQMPLNKKVMDFGQYISSADYINGGAITISRIPLNDFLKKENNKYNHQSLDSLFFEKIPGDILQKKYTEAKNYTEYDILSKTKTGNSQHRRFYITPLEIISITLGGAGQYAAQFENTIFDHITIKDFKNSWEKITPLKGGFSVEIPYFNTVYGNTTEAINDIDIQAYDSTEGGYYFLTEKTLNDYDQLENSLFEQSQIHYEFYAHQKIKADETTLDTSKKEYESHAKIGAKKIDLKTIIKGNKYYLLGTVNVSDKNKTRFFDSFAAQPFLYNSVNKTYTDSSLGYKIQIPEKENQTLLLDLNPDTYQKKESFSVINKNKSFYSESGKKIELNYYKYPKYYSTENLDSIKNYFKEICLDSPTGFIETEDDFDYDEDMDYTETPSSLNLFPSKWNDILYNEKEKNILLGESEQYDKDTKTYTYEALVSKPNSNQAIKNKYVFTGDRYYSLKTIVEQDYKKQDAFIESAFNSFAPLEKTSGTLFEDKVNLFLEDAASKNDTIRYSALRSVDNLKLKKEDFQKISNFVNTFKFKPTENSAFETLIDKIGEMKHPGVTAFLSDLYQNKKIKTSTQLQILKALARQKTKQDYQKIIELLEYDLPITDNEYQISELFSAFLEDKTNSKELFPRIFQFYSIKEYNKPILAFCNSLAEDQLISLKKIKEFKKILITNAKLEYKRIISWKESQNNNANDLISDLSIPIVEGSTSEEEIENEVDKAAMAIANENKLTSGDAPIEDLLNYAILLSHFPKESAINDLLFKINELNIPSISIQMLKLKLINNTATKEDIEKSLANSDTAFPTVQLLINNNRKNQINLSDETIAQAAFLSENRNIKKENITLLEKRTIVKNGKNVTVFFFKETRKNEETDEETKKLHTIVFVNDNDVINPEAYKVYKSHVMKENETFPESCETTIHKIINENHSRANFDDATSLPQMD